MKFKGPVHSNNHKTHTWCHPTDKGSFSLSRTCRVANYSDDIFGEKNLRVGANPGCNQLTVRGETRSRMGEAAYQSAFPNIWKSWWVWSSSVPREGGSLNPLTDEGLITLCNVLHGTSRHPIKSKPGNDAFLSGDYELAERVQSTVQKEAESIRDVAYMYQSLCIRWQPTISEGDVVKMILKNINPQLASTKEHLG